MDTHFTTNPSIYLTHVTSVEDITPPHWCGAVHQATQVWAEAGTSATT